MKNKLILITSLLLLGVLAIGANVIVAQVTSPTRITNACESTSGLLLAVNDGYSRLTECPPNTRPVVLGEDVGNDGGSVGDGTGYVRFADGFTVLTELGEVWLLSGGVWEKYNVTPIDPNIVDNIVSWTLAAFLTDSNYYILNYNHISGTPTYESVDFPLKSEVTPTPTN